MIWRLFMQGQATRLTTGGAPSPENYLSDVSATVFWPCGSHCSALSAQCWSYPEKWLGMGVLHDDRGHRFDVGGHAVGVLLGKQLSSDDQPE